MMYFRDATKLAVTKLRTRKVRLIITIIVSGLLFSGLMGASMVARGAFASINDFGKEGLGERYIVQAHGGASGDPYNDPAVLDRATELYNQTVARKKAEAKRLGIEYDAASDPPPVMEYDTPGGKQRSLTPNSVIANQAIAEYLAQHPTAGLADLKKMTSKYDPKAFFESRYMPYLMDGTRLQVLKDGKESFDTGKQEMRGGPPTGIDTFLGSWSLMSSGLLEPFILPGQDLKRGADGSIPIIVPYAAAEEILNLKALPSTAKTQERLDRTREVREKAASVRFGVCYRNSSSSELVDQAVSTQAELERNKNKKDYQKPDLIHSLPDQPCGTTAITRDVRSSAQKTFDAKQLQFDEAFGKPAPEQAVMSFRIVGIVPDAPGFNASAVSQIISSLVTSSLGTGWYTPIEQAADQPLLKKLFFESIGTYQMGSTYYAEFKTADQARRFIANNSCEPDYDAAISSQGSFNPFQACVDQGKPFTLVPFGSNSLALEGAKRGFGRFFTIAALVVALIGVIIMMGTVGRLIADSRRETAVFRAIGAKKLDISQIYICYTILLSLLVLLFALLVGLGFALLVNSKWSDEMTMQALVAYNARDLSKTFDLYSFYLPDMLFLAALVVGSGMISALFPLFRNLRRNPIRDMRDEN